MRMRRHRRHDAARHLSARAVAPLLLVVAGCCLVPLPAEAATFDWVSATDGYWDVASNWSTGTVPNSSTNLVTLDVPQDVLVTHRTGTTSVDQITARERFALTGGTLKIYGSSGPSVFTQSFTQSGGTLGGTGEVQLQGAGSSWTGGTWTDGGITRVLSGADLTVSGGYHTQAYRSLDIDTGGQVNWSGGRWYMDYGATIDNQGSFVITSNEYLDSRYGTGGSFINSGTLTKQTATGTTYFDVTFDNAGIVDVRSGRITFTRGVTQLSGNTLTGGTWRVTDGYIQISNATIDTIGAGATVRLDGTGRFESLASSITVQGTLMGDTGTYTGTVLNQGTVAPGASPGTLSINGSYTQDSTGLLQIEIGGREQGVTYDWLQIYGTPGTASLAGTLEVILTGGFLPNINEEFVFLTATGGVSGTFDTLLSENGWELRYEPNQVVLTFKGLAVPEPQTWLTAAFAFVALLLRLRGRRC